VGVEIVHNKEQMKAALEQAFSYGDTAVVDAFIPGREVRCGVIEMKNGQVQTLPCLEYKVGLTDCTKQGYHSFVYRWPLTTLELTLTSWREILRT